ncbi:MAG: YfbK domain-containing protein [Rhizobiaceae bacterium]
MSDPDFDLSRLGRTPVPEPRRKAIDAAKRSGLDAFDASAKNNVKATKGTGVLVRLSRIATQTWSHTMNAKYLTGSALATVIIAPIVGISAYQIMNERNQVPGVVEIAASDDALELRKEKSAPVGQVTKTEAGDALPEPALVAPKVEAPIANESAAVAEGDKALENLQGAASSQAPAVAAAPEMDALVEPSAPAPSKPLVRQKLAAPGTKGMLDTEAPIAEENRDNFPKAKSNSVVAVTDQPVSTFSVDVDTSGYSSLRRALNQGAIPAADTVRIEEMVNYFPYGYKGPDNATEAFNANVTVTPTPWNQNTKLLHVGIKGFDLPVTEQKSANLVFLIDVSGSMGEPDKLPLLKSSFRLLVNKLKPTDTVSIVTYAGDAGIVLEPTKASDSAKILNAIDNLQPGGSTAGEAGINAAYQLAQQAFVKDGVNRIMLATDGDFNVGAASDDELKKLVEEKRKSGVFLSVLGFGEGNYQDNLMQTLAQNGNGIAAYIDTLSEAEKVLVQEATASLFTIAKDVKIQVEFNPARVSEYRLIGYETRALANEDFNNDRVDAGDIGSGHTVTAIYEMTPKGAPGQTNDSLRYQEKAEPSGDQNGEFAFVKIRYKLPTENTSRLVTQPVSNANAVDDIAKASDDVRFGIAVSALGQKLRDEDATANYAVEDIEKLAESAKGSDAYGYRSEFLKLVRLVKSLLPK